MEEVRYLISSRVFSPAGVINRDGMVVVSTEKSQEGKKG